MKPKNLNDELKIREKIQGCTTPVQDNDWQKMLALLENNTDEGGKPLPETPQPGPAQPSNKRKYLVLLFLGLLTVGGWATVAGLLPDFFSPNIPAQQSGSGTLSVVSEQLGSGRASESGSQIQENKKDPSLGGIGELNPQFEETTFPQRLTNQQITSSEISSSTAAQTSGKQPIPSETTSTTAAQTSGKRPIPSETSSLTAAPTSGKQPIPSETTSTTAAQTSGKQPIPSETTSSTAATMGGELTAPIGETSSLTTSRLNSESTVSLTPQTPFWEDLQALYPLPQATTALTLPLLRPDSIIRPTTQMPRKPRRFQRGMVLGGNLNIVNYEAGRLSIMPQLGYHWSTPLQGQYRFQAELLLKNVTNYQERAEFFYVAPGGSLEIILEMKNLFFIEMPLLLKQENQGIGKMTWLAGVKPAWCTPIFSYGSYSSSGTGFGPRVDLRLRDGIRAFDLGLVFGMEWRFAPRWSLDMRYNQGFLDLTHDNFFKNKTTHLNSDVQVTLHHYIHPYKRNRHAKHTLFPEPHRDH